MPAYSLFRAFTLGLCLGMASVPVFGQASGTPDMRLDAGERTAILEGMAAKLKAEYVYPELAEKMGQAIRLRAERKEYDAIDSPSDLASKLTADLREVSGDKHLWVAFQPGGARDEPVDGPSVEEMDSWRDAVARDNFAFDKVERMDGNVGYVKFRIFAYPYLAADTASAAMSFVANTDALIIDLRQNQGGDPAMVAYLLSYLFDERTHLNDIYIRKGGKTEQYWTLPDVPGQVFGGSKPVYVLTSHDTFSAAEDFSYALKNLKRARIVGEATGGGAHPSRVFKVTEYFAISIPYARSISPITQANWEGGGVTPDIAVPAGDALQVAYGHALRALADSTIDMDRKKQLEDLLGKER